MALKEFWVSVRTAASLMLPKAAVDSPRLDRDRIEKILRGATFWLTPGAVKGYESGDFDFLADEERERLDKGVNEFKAVAATVTGNIPATEEQIDKGVTAFRKVLEVIRPDKYPDFEAFITGKKVENQVRGEIPEWVKELVFETGYDSVGDPALWIWVEVEDFAAEDEVLRENYRLIREILGGAAAQVCPGRWPYVRLRTVSEQRPLAQVNRR